MDGWFYRHSIITAEAKAKTLVADLLGVWTQTRHNALEQGHREDAVAFSNFVRDELVLALPWLWHQGDEPED